nr:alpha/beta hydrolases superfamily protein [Tanacetum cinerariifolium]GEX40477.1 alpha/beta hydrolases superfamily protein [Tanacetum cinerariifolium]
MTTRESATIESTNSIKLDARIYKPTTTASNKIGVVLVHPYSVLGGCQGLMKGIARNLADQGFPSVTFDMRGVGKSTGRCSITGFSEVSDVIAVCKWCCNNLEVDKVLLVGSSAGAPIAGSAVDQVDEIVGYVSLGYPFGLTASILFGRHQKTILQSPKPKLFVMGTKDGFTSVKQLANKIKTAAGRAETHLIEGASHFQMEGPAYDTEMANLIVTFISSL